MTVTKETFKVVYNACYGGYGLSKACIARIKELDDSYKKLSEYDFSYKLERHDPALVKAVEELGKAAGSSYSDLQIAIINCRTYKIDEYDGSESVVTPSYNLDEWTVIG